jgi:ubiquinone/menaquinone biosynthesis C-methylase UbiE
MIASFRRNARLKKPRALLPGLLDHPEGIWVDAASGDGVFAEVLLELSRSTLIVIGIDLRRSAVENFNHAVCHANTAIALQANLNSPLPIRPIDGILIANGLHFFDQSIQIRILDNCYRALKDSGSLVIVEYNTAESTGVVPFPIPIASIDGLIATCGFEPVNKTTRVDSTYLEEMYAILTKKKEPGKSY